MNRSEIEAAQKTVILSGAARTRSARPAESKDPAFASPLNRLSKEFSLRTFGACLFVALLSLAASAQTLTGTVKNATTNKPAAGDEVILISLGQGMEEAGRTKADAKGNFSFTLDKPGPHLVRVIHQEVTYHRMAPPGSTSVEVQVYDVAKKIEGLTVVADIMRFQAGQGQLQIERTFSVQNDSKPPRTQMNEHNLEFYVPDGATIGEGEAMTEGGQPLKSAPVPETNAKNKYAFLFPLRPGETRFNVVYTMPYTGSVNIDPKSVYALDHFVAIAPKAMNFAAAPGASFKVAPYPGQPDANVEVASNSKLGESLAFKLTGEGLLQNPADEQGGQQADNRPGGGLGPPIDAPNPLQQKQWLGIQYTWWILGALGLALVIGGVFVATRQQSANRAARAAGLSPMQEADDFEVPPSAGRRPAQPPAVPDTQRSSVLLQALKDEIFDLEVEHKQGRVSQEEYEKTKAALDQTLERALKREAEKHS